MGVGGISVCHDFGGAGYGGGRVVGGVMGGELVRDGMEERKGFLLLWPISDMGDTKGYRLMTVRCWLRGIVQESQV